jgi:peptidoglycan-N-acetylglucosamine deacetylase
VPALALTFDDGPDPAWTPRLLDLLCELGARATFFPIAVRAAGNPAIIERMQADVG